jgi:hypothetical protein
VNVHRTLFILQAAGVKRLLFCGVGCQVQGTTPNMTAHGSSRIKLVVLGRYSTTHELITILYSECLTE